MNVSNSVGIGRSAVKTGTINSGESSIGDPLNLGREYNFLVIRIPDCSNVADSSALRLSIGDTNNDSMCQFTDRNSGNEDIVDLPTSGSFRYILPILGVRRVTVITSVVTDGDVAIEVFGVEPVIGV